MSSDPITLADLAALPAGQTLALTVNNRLARRLTQALARHVRRQRQVSELPRIAPLSAWLDETADALAYGNPGADGAQQGESSARHDLPAYRLNSFAAQMLWMDVIAEVERDRPLLDEAQAARLAAQADALLDEWRLHVPDAAQTDEYRGFTRWRRRYRERLDEIDAEDSNCLYARVLDAARAGRLPAPPHVVLAGFTEQSPRFVLLLEALRAGGAQIYEYCEDDEPGGGGQARRVEAPDHAAEWRAAAAWAAQRLSENPQGRYAIVCAGLENEAPFARRVLGQALAAPRQVFNVAVGRPLADWPIARAALAWLDAAAALAQHGQAEAALLGAALLAGHCAGDERDAALHASTDAQWRRDGAARVTRAQWLDSLARTALASAWPRVEEIWQDARAAMPTDQWAQRMRSSLGALGFPGEHGLDSVAWQAMTAFSGLLDSFSALAPAAGMLDAVGAVQLLARAARSSAFQPQRDPQARLDVLGLLEAEGGSWDGVWILGLTDTELPASPKPNPFLPLPVLRAANAPRATPERERQWAEALFAALRRCAPEVMVSFALHEGEKAQRSSPLIAELPLADWRMPAMAPDAELALEQIDDSQGPALQESEQSYTRGGVSVLDTQAVNPLWAFARYRLGASGMKPHAQLAAASARGVFLHKALEILWKTLGNQDALHAASLHEARLDSLIAQAVAHAAQEKLADAAPVLRELESQRARRVLRAWLDLESQRAPFEVEHTEQRRNWQHKAFKLAARLDRVDRLLDGDGRLAVIDYKTGMNLGNPRADWSRERPVNLQLPFYAAVLADDARQAAALILAQIHARQVSVNGVADAKAELGWPAVRGLPDEKLFSGRSWEDVVRGWRRAIENLAEEFAAGYAANFVAHPKDLAYCDALPFLRLMLETADESEDA